MATDPTGLIIKIDGKAISKVGIKLIQKVSDGIGGIYEPLGTVRKAKANAKAALIAALADEQVAEIQRRAMHRFVAEETRRQENIERITAEAIPHLDDDAEPANVDDDWMANFFDKAKAISDVDMQRIWSKILADESNQPGRFSKKTVNLLADIDKTDAQTFNTLCRFSAHIGGPQLLVFDPNAAIYMAHNINFNVISHLDSLGLIRFDQLAGFSLLGLPQQFSFVYGDKNFNIQQKKPSDHFQTGKVLLTKMGRELMTIIDVEPVPGFSDYIASEYTKTGVLNSLGSNETLNVSDGG